MKTKTFPVLGAAVLATVVLASMSQITLGEDAKGKGSLSGTVTSSTGTKLAGVVVKIMAPKDVTGTGGSDGGRRGKDSSGNQPIELARGTALATVKTDADGKFTFKTLAVGEFAYNAGSPITVGYASGRVKIEDGKETTLDIKLGEPAK